MFGSIWPDLGKTMDSAMIWRGLQNGSKMLEILARRVFSPKQAFNPPNRLLEGFRARLRVSNPQFPLKMAENASKPVKTYHSREETTGANQNW